MTRSIEQSIRDAYPVEGSCPSPESFLAESLERLSTDEREELERHTERCPRCSTERDLARGFEDPVEADREDEDVDTVVRALRTAGPLGSRRGDAGEVETSHRASFSWWRSRGLAAAAVAAFALIGGWVALRTPAPDLPPIGGAAVFRGDRLGGLTPEGDLDRLPTQLVWEEVPEASSYHVRLLAVDDTVLWETTLEGPPAVIPGGVAERMNAAVSYTWRVDGLDAAGRRVAGSAPTTFRVRPAKP